jgi:hypothetical protein
MHWVQELSLRGGRANRPKHEANQSRPCSAQTKQVTNTLPFRFIANFSSFFTQISVWCVVSTDTRPNKEHRQDVTSHEAESRTWPTLVHPLQRCRHERSCAGDRRVGGEGQGQVLRGYTMQSGRY